MSTVEKANPLLRVSAPRALGVAVAVIGMLLLLCGAQSAKAATPAWKVMGVTGPTHLIPALPERQTVTGPLFGTFTLTYGADTTAPIATGALATGPGSVEEALNALPSITNGGGSVTVRYDLGKYVVTFDGGPLAGTDVPSMTATGIGASVQPTSAGMIAVYATNVGGLDTSGVYTLSVELPDGIVTASAPTTYATATQGRAPWACGAAGAGESTLTCTRSETVYAGTTAPTLNIPVAVAPAVVGELAAELSVSGGGATSGASYTEPITVSATPAEHGVQAMWAGAFDENGNPETRAGAHPFSAIATFFMNTKLSTVGRIVPVDTTKQVEVELPAGFVGNPMAAPRCQRALWYCDPDALVGDASVEISRFGQGFEVVRSRIANVLPPKGSPVELTFQTMSTRAKTTARLRQSDYGVTSIASNLPDTYHFYGSSITLWGQPGNSVHDPIRCDAVPYVCDEPVDGGVEAAFVTNPTECSGLVLPTSVATNTWQNPTVFSGPLSDDSPAVTGCGSVPFDPTVTTASSSARRDAASGLDFDLEVPQDGLLDYDGIATSHLKDVAVDLPDGVAVNPSAATGLAGCSDAQMAVGSDSAPTCPDGSKIGTVQIVSRLVDRPIGGALYLGVPKSTDPGSGEMFRLFVVARDEDLGVTVKVPGSATADPNTGKLRATFENNPRLPFDHLSVKLKGGDRGVLALPQTCGQYGPATTLGPWSQAHLVPGDRTPVVDSDDWAVDQDCDFGFDPGLRAGVDNAAGRGRGSYSFEFTRPEGDQWVNGLTAKLPKGLLASVKGVPLCTDAQAAADDCPAASQIGTVDASAGSGDPFVLERKGDVYLTEGYKGGPYGLLVKVRAIAGPFRDAMELTPIVVRQKIDVDPVTAEISAVSDPLPTVWHGVPLRVRRVLVKVDRPSFILNPSGCAAKQTTARLSSPQGTVAERTSPFQARDCTRLGFEPKLTLGLTGRKQVTTGKHPGIKAKVTQAGMTEAGIERVEVRLPKSLALDPENAQALCEFADGTKPDLENHCPKGSIVGRARANTPLLDRDLTGNVYFIKNVRRDPKTGNTIRTLPMIVVALRGEIAINLKGESSTMKDGRLVNTFASVPDAPISQFNLNINGGRNGILAVTRTRKAKINLCTGRHTAEADIDGHNTRRADSNIRMKTPCTKKQTKKAKRAAAKARAGSKRG